MNSALVGFKKIFWNFRRQLKTTPIFKIFNWIKTEGFHLKQLRVLEVFGGSGDRTVADYYASVGKVEIWELDPSCETQLRKRFPEAEIKIADSYQALKQTKDRYDLVFMDPWPYCFAGNRCESFDFFPDAFDVLKEKGIIVTNVILNLKKNQFTKEHIKRRAEFYGTSDGLNISFKKMIETYQEMAASKGLKLVKWRLIDRYFMYLPRRFFMRKRLCFLVMVFEKR